MSNVEFESDFQQAGRSPSRVGSSGTPSFGIQRSGGQGIIGWMVRKGLVKNEEAARLVLLVIIVVNFSIIGFIIYTSFVGPVSTQNPSSGSSAGQPNPAFKVHHRL